LLNKPVSQTYRLISVLRLWNQPPEILDVSWFSPFKSGRLNQAEFTKSSSARRRRLVPIQRIESNKQRDECLETAKHKNQSRNLVPASQA
jgi:hypothetical protein